MAALVVRVRARAAVLALPSRRGIGVAVERWQDESWAQGAAAIVLATPFDSDGVAGDQGRLVRERLVEQSARRRERRATAPVIAAPTHAAAAREHARVRTVRTP